MQLDSYQWFFLCFFLIAMDGDVTALQGIVEKAMNNEEVLSHDVTQLVNVANQTQKLVSENRMDIRQLKQHEDALLAQANWMSIL